MEKELDLFALTILLTWADRQWNWAAASSGAILLSCNGAVLKYFCLWAIKREAEKWQIGHVCHKNIFLYYEIREDGKRGSYWPKNTGRLNWKVLIST